MLAILRVLQGRPKLAVNIIRPDLILVFHVCFNLSCGLFLWGFITKILYAFIISLHMLYILPIPSLMLSSQYYVMNNTNYEAS
jgi:hypothetical protein